MALRQILSNLNVAVVSPFGALSLFADFENMSEFKQVNTIMNQLKVQLIKWFFGQKL